MSKTQKIRFKDTLSLATNTILVSLIIFLMIEVVWAQTLKDLIIDRYGSPSGLLTFIIIGGFLLSAIVSLLSSLLTTNKILRKYGYWAALLAFLLNLTIWILISYFAILIRYPEVTQELNIIEKIIAIPNIMAYFGIYFLSNVTLLWILGLVTYSILFALFMYLIAKKKSNKKYAYQKWEL